MITVTYAPSDSGSIGPNGEKGLKFNTHADFRDWVEGYICESCHSWFEESNGRDMETVREYLGSGCGCEVTIVDPDGMIG